ncbi:MAG: COX15/CtaA family protein [Pirellulaceae bacterium]|nr:COX15/CtaA family protein [Pirellulaceae bacterium]
MSQGRQVQPTAEVRHCNSVDSGYCRIVHGLAVSLTIAVFPLIWVGGLVTTYGAGMAVPDWPGTYGWNMFLYPPSTWLYGGFDLMVEHGHRLLGSLAGMLSIALVVAAMRWDQRCWFRRWCVIVLLAVIAQGVLGGLRVRLDERFVALIHGCIAQLFLAMATATAVMSSRWWHAAEPRGGSSASASRRLAIIASALLLLAYAQVVAGAHLRHAAVDTQPGTFMGFVHIHLMLAALVAMTSVTAAVLTGRQQLFGGVKRPAKLILLVIVCQVFLGCGTWLVRYALPWQELSSGLAQYTIRAQGYWESAIVTGHVATGALVISLATMLTLRAWRSRWYP